MAGQCMMKVASPTLFQREVANLVNVDKHGFLPLRKPPCLIAVVRKSGTGERGAVMSLALPQISTTPVLGKATADQPLHTTRQRSHGTECRDSWCFAPAEVCSRRPFVPMILDWLCLNQSLSRLLFVQSTRNDAMVRENARGCWPIAWRDTFVRTSTAANGGDSVKAGMANVCHSAPSILIGSRCRAAIRCIPAAAMPWIVLLCWIVVVDSPPRTASCEHGVRHIGSSRVLLFLAMRFTF